MFHRRLQSMPVIPKPTLVKPTALPAKVYKTTNSPKQPVKNYFRSSAVSTPKPVWAI
ncbi:MAG: hypothetical protein LBJ00_07785 [Planctomycetaceae bacterium]|nr:hypothetical protein [Planctomycetaceae bacterium]